jgi:hypothetical protein
MLRRSYWIIAHADVAQTARGRRMIEFLSEEAAMVQDQFLGSPHRASPNPPNNDPLSTTGSAWGKQERQ